MMALRLKLLKLNQNFSLQHLPTMKSLVDENEKVFIYENHIDHNIKTDRTLLKQLMTILFDNAVKYTEEDGVIKFIVWSKDRSLYLRVSDNGPGINNEDKKENF